ncbi:periplasmic sensor signal transduction histidine kinase [Magnetococcus marinus MC-1]|uniref:histidine kinase n=1 Tax=Magnetococcus marinus (strain ATCC BAA-1437 / JCM 17883 / MC-1) TaxID=156889 RepID=A0L9Y6_MAGMM|nr:HAMP domain-containing sensor histidine kinase [Magnetococcus marinus]ABK44779.1 periplasmic sensor signal transduction histidine kinase [Magnetococcus marinus MC-1]
MTLAHWLYWIPNPFQKVVALFCIITLGAAILLLHYLIGLSYEFHIFLSIPVLLSSWFLGLTVGIAVAVLTVTAWLQIDWILDHETETHAALVFNSIMRLIISLIGAYIFSKLRETLESLSKHNNYLYNEQALVKENIRLREDAEHITRHNLKSPLNFIIGAPDILLESDNLTQEQRTLIQQIQKTGYRMINEINHSLILYRIEKGLYTLNPVLIQLYPMLQRVKEELTPLAKQMGVGIEIHYHSNTVAMGEEMLIFSVFNNLIKNAVEASANGDRVTVTLTGEASPQVTIHNPAVVAESVRARFFDKLATANKPGGTGLGTYAAQLIVHAHGGEVAMITSEQEGTLVTITLTQNASC